MDQIADKKLENSENQNSRKLDITVLDYGMGNIYSVVKALELFGARVTLSADLDFISQSQVLVMPGDGAFGAAMAHLKEKEMLPVLNRHIEDNKWLLGICVGFQILFEESEEFGHHKGLGIFPGKVERFRGDFTIPHMGWNNVELLDLNHPVFHGLQEKLNFYFIHSYFAKCRDDSLVLGKCNYHGDFSAIVGKDRIFATQFHPEKSHEDGLKIIENFCQMLKNEREN